jgi:adenylyltransferase/sulfurtransferase
MNQNREKRKPLSPEEIARYSRHIILPNVGLKGQEILSHAKILVIGMGGLGSPVALYLGAAGIGTLGLADFDRIEEHNLQRQILHKTSRVGSSKTESAIAEIQDLNPAVTLQNHSEGVTIENAHSLFINYDLVVDGSDNFPTRYLVNDAAFFTKKPLVYGSIFQFEGQVSIFDTSEGGPCYRCLFPKMPAPGVVPNCEEAGVFGALCGVVGSIQAMEAIKYLLGLGEAMKGRLLVTEALSMNFRTLNLKRDPNCPLCGDNPTILNLKAQNYEFQCDVPNAEDTAGSNVATHPLEITVEEAHSILNSEVHCLLIDVREPYEVEICSIEGSINIPMGQIPERYESLPRNHPIFIHCHHGSRSFKATQFLRSKGFKFASNIGGGINAWAHKIDPSIRFY